MSSILNFDLLLLLLTQLTTSVSDGEMDKNPPVSLEMQWVDNDANGGFYTVNISVAHRPRINW
jgi:hypothetical protein